MRNRFAVCTALLLAFAAPTAFAAGPPAPDADKPADAQAVPRLDTLFAELKRERNEKAAERIASRIWAEWDKSGSATIDLMMLWSKQAADARKFDVALDFLDQVVVMDPSFPEGWNRRATVHFMMQNYAKSMSDISQTLVREPRHFGALAGMAQIMKSTGHKQRALDAWQRVLEIYPMMRNAQGEVAALSEELSGEGI